MGSNLSVGIPIDLICYERDSLEVQRQQRFDRGTPISPPSAANRAKVCGEYFAICPICRRDRLSRWTPSSSPVNTAATG